MIWSKHAETAGLEESEVAGQLGILMQIMYGETWNKMVIRMEKRDGEGKHFIIHHCVCMWAHDKLRRH